ncbi:MAG TPA: penicillin-binding transpeptidase domain-containing protein [Pyrinomonadaceae bacterium]|jgi:cell division protein FtsI/penicillin-binding protein 2|nr:penicillin-binding transpeptidase domain-containing protein [Pyrinomonadaceae bacterium]
MLLLQDIPEKQPALLSLIYLAGMGLMALWLVVSLVRNMRRRRTALAAVASSDLPKEVRQRLGATSTNRGLHALRWFFIALALAVLGFHVYWARYAEEKNERFQELSYKDLRNRRLAESTLRGWIFDRTGTLERALALYRRGPNGQIVREYPLDMEMAQLFGSDRGDAGLERALFGIQSGAAPEAVDVLMERDVKQPANLDVRLTIDAELQKAVVEQLRDRHGAVVILNPQTGEVLAMYSNPSYSLKEVQDAETWIRLEANKRDNPLVNRALGAYYIPGSTFKTITMTAAYHAGMSDAQFTCSGSGYVASPGAKAVFDDQGPGEVHGRIGVDKAYEVSCNQYFAQLAVKLGPERMAEAARLLGIVPYETPAEAVRGRREPQLWNVSLPSIARALAPREATLVLYPKMRAFDLALIGYGQGYAGQMTPFQMALAAAAVANVEGKLMKPKIEYNVAPAAFAQAATPEHAAQMRRIMGLVTGGESGTARGVFGPVHAAGIITGGKTGTAEKEVPVYDPKTGEPKTVKKVERDRRGNIIREYQQIEISPEHRIDSWFLCIAPLDRPQVAMAVIIEGGGYGSKAAAPVAAALVLKARELGLLGLPAQAAPPQQGQPVAASPSPSGNQQRQTPNRTTTPQTQTSPAGQRRERKPPAQAAQR